MEKTPAICNGCGDESPAWDQLCHQCAQTVTCQNCLNKYKRGQGLQEVNLCADCLQEIFSKDDEDEEELFRPSKVKATPELNDTEDYGFDHHWELYER